MKKFILLVCIIFSMSALVAYAMTIEPIYTCIDGYTIYSGYTMDDKKLLNLVHILFQIKRQKIISYALKNLVI